ncbi:MAG: formylglycine-generating enzyme family protein [Gammaproteobacteria bacterium]
MTWPEHMEHIYPELFPEPWASGWGEDRFGLWMSFTFEGVVQRFRWIAPGTLQMGSPANEKGRRDDETPHEVTLTRGYWLAETACTQALWEAVMGDNPGDFEGEDRPVDSVSWNRANAFIGRLNERLPELALRLPSEAEWEFACRAGTTTAYSFGDTISSEQVNFGNNNQGTVPVASLPPNDWGLYEMHGNLWEWCADWRRPYPAEPVTDPSGPASGDYRVLRGGSWLDDAALCRSAQRDGFHPSFVWRNYGFRLARGLRAAEPQKQGARPGSGPEP